MRSLLKLKVFVAILTLALVFCIGCGSTEEDPEVEKNPDTAAKKSAPTSTTAKKTPGLGQTMMSYQGKKKHLYGYIEYPGFWRLSVIPGIEKTPGIKRPTEIHCDYRLRSLKALIIIKVTDKDRSSSSVLKAAKQKILNLYPESFFKQSPAVMVGIGSETLKGKKASGDIDEIDQLNVPKFDGELPPISGYSKYKVTADGEKEEYLSGGEKGGALPSELFIRNERWEKDKEIWVQVPKVNVKVKFAGKIPVLFTGEFIYDQKLYYVLVKAAKVDKNTIIGLFICPKDNYRVYYRAFDWISKKFAINKTR